MEQIDILSNERCQPDLTEAEVARHDFFENLSLLETKEEMMEMLAVSAYA